MNHRELVLSARRRMRFAFLTLPEDLQDEIIDGLDSMTLTLHEASAQIASRGHRLSYEGVAAYYRAVRTERRLAEVNHELSRVIAEFAAKPRDEALDSLVKLVIATATSGVADGTVGIKDINLAKLVEASAKAHGEPAPPANLQGGNPAGAPSAQKKGQVPQDTLDAIRRDVYGL